MSFPLSHLPLELALEILHLAATPDILQQARPRIYETARALALVSHSFRNVVMPHLLHTVILSTQQSVQLFNQSLQQQKQHAYNRSRLSLNYPGLVRRFWSSQCFDPIVQQPQDHFQSYELFYEIFRKAETLGFNYMSLHLLYETLGGACDIDPQQWDCKRVTFAGINPRWNPLTSTASGLAFLKQLTHLTLWVPSHDSLIPIVQSNHRHSHTPPNWIQRVPFEFMPNLTHFAFSLVYHPGSTTTPVLVYTLPSALPRSEKPTIFRSWANSSDPLAYGQVFYASICGPQECPFLDNSNVEMAFLRGENNIWPYS